MKLDKGDGVRPDKSHLLSKTHMCGFAVIPLLVKADRAFIGYFILISVEALFSHG